MSQPSLFPGFSTEELADVYSTGSTVAAMLEFEAALALALADAGIAPRAEAQQVAKACQGEVDDPEAILASTWDSGTPIIALREVIDAGSWFHHGATSQDAVDTAQMLQAGRALETLDRRLVSIADRLRDLTAEHRDQPHMGRTFLQDARPTTFGFRTATWLDAVLDHIVELRDQRSNLPIQLGGPVGTRESYGDAGAQVVEALAERLGLSVPDISWHTNRSRVLSLAQAVERTAYTMAKIGTDIALLSSSAVGEVSVRSGGSSSMPHKQNPIDSIHAVAAASACAGAVAMLTSAPPHELDRAVGGWHVEWTALPLVFQTAGAAIEAIDLCLASLEVDQEAMAAPVETPTPTDQSQINKVLARHAAVLARGTGNLR